MQTQERSSHACERKGKKTQGQSIAYWDMAIQDPRAQSGRSHRCPANTNANVCFKCLCGKDIESETTQTECLCLDEKEASELERELEVEALNHLL